MLAKNISKRLKEAIMSNNNEIESKVAETLEGTTVYKVPFPKDIKSLKDMSPIVIKYPYQINYIHSFGQDSPFFAGLANGKLLGTKCLKCGYTYATPKMACMQCGGDCDWIELPTEGKIHTWTTCYFGSEEFLKETPYTLILVEFKGANTLFLSRLIGHKEGQVGIGMKVKAKFVRNAKLKPTDVYFVPA